MEIFFSHAPAWVLASYWMAASVTVAYMCWKLAARRYLFSPYSIVVLTFAFALLIVAPFQYNSEAWAVLGRPNAAPFWQYLDLSIGVNAAGFALIVATMWWVERRPKPPHHPPFIRRPPQIPIAAVAVALTCGVVIFLGCLAVVGTIPLFGDRTVFNSQPSLRPVYNFANYLILFTTSAVVVWSFITRSWRYSFLVLAGLTCMFFTGGRTSFLSVVELILLMWLYLRYRSRPLRATAVLAAGLGFVAIGGLFLASFRTGSEFDIASSLRTALYGNTFSDVRDGAYVASAWDRYMSAEGLDGNTYLAGLMSFIPSSVSVFRESWSWGYFTTSSLFGFTDHYGFRGGWSLEMYMNFGPAGVISAALACGWILGRLESLFHRGVVLGHADWYPNAYTWSWLGYGLFTVLIASSATYNLYSLVLIIGMLWIISKVRESIHRALGLDRRLGAKLSEPMMGYNLPLPQTEKPSGERTP